MKTFRHQEAISDSDVLTGRPEAFKAALGYLGFTSAGFATEWGVSRETVSRWNAGVPRGVMLYLQLRLRVRTMAEELAELGAARV